MITVITYGCIGLAVLPCLAIGFFKMLEWAGQVEDEPAEPASTAKSDIRP